MNEYPRGVQDFDLPLRRMEPMLCSPHDVVILFVLILTLTYVRIYYVLRGDKEKAQSVLQEAVATKRKQKLLLKKNLARGPDMLKRSCVSMPV